MARGTGASYSSSNSSSNSSNNSVFTKASKHTYTTNASSCDGSRPMLKHCDTAPTFAKHITREPVVYSDSDDDEGLARSSASSVNTYASTNDSREELVSESSDKFPKERNQCFAPDAFPTTPPDFAELFPSTRRLLIQHDDTAVDGNMNLRVDTDVTTRSGRRKKMTLFHLRMKDLPERQFSLRRYCRDSGREVVSSKRRYIKPLPPNLKYQKPSFQRSFTHALHNLGRPMPTRQDSGYESEEDDQDDELEASLRAWTLNSDVKATVPTTAMRLEFSNYAQVIIDPRRTSDGKEYAFEYWGEYYTWRRRLIRDGGEIIASYELLNANSSKRIATVVPDALSTEETEFEAAQGAWIPASTMRLLSDSISDDLGDVIVATGLMALTDDCLSRHDRPGCKLG